MEFKEWFNIQENAHGPATKQALYCLGYGGIGLYTPPDYVTWGGDAITYLPTDNRFLKFIWGKGILANPFRKDSLYSSVEGKIAPQIEAGSIRSSGKRFEKCPYIRTFLDNGLKKSREIADRSEIVVPKDEAI